MVFTEFKQVTLPFFIVYICICVIQTAYAGIDSIRFDHVSLEQGLSQSSVYAIVQDTYGFMWFGTQDGLNMYDGYEFTVYRHDPEDGRSISESQINSIYEDKDGHLWIGTNGGGLNFFDRIRGAFTCYRHDIHNPESISDNNVTVIMEDTHGTLWIGTGNGLNSFNRQQQIFRHYRYSSGDPDSLSDNSIKAIHEDHEGYLWIGTERGGLNRFSRDRETFVRYTSEPANPESLSNNHVWSICEDSRHTLWVGTWGGGLNRYDRATESFRRCDDMGFDDRAAKFIFEDRDGVLWVGSKSNGLYRLDRSTGKFLNYQAGYHDPYSLSHNYITSIYQDRGGVLWVGTLAGGLNKFNPNSMKSVVRHYTHIPYNEKSLCNEKVWSVIEDSGKNIWVGTDGGLSRMNGGERAFTHYLGGFNDSVRSLHEDHEGIIWVGTLNTGLIKLGKDGKILGHYLKGNREGGVSDNTVLSIYEDSFSRLWIGTWGGGLCLLDRETERFRNYRNTPGVSGSLSHDVVRAIAEDRDGNLWIGTSDGLNVLDQGRGLFRVYRHDPARPGSLSHNTVRSIHVSSRGELWIGTSGGLNRYNRAADSFDSYRLQDGLPNETIYGILEDKRGCLWLSTNQGISMFDSQKEVFRNYDVRDGLQYNEFNAGAYGGGNSRPLYFGGVNGLNVIFPDQIKKNPYRPPVVLTRFQKYFKDTGLNQPVFDLRTITLSRRDTVFSFEFAALDYTEPAKNQYAYKLEGFDESWIYSNNRRLAIYTNLDAGSYVFRFKGSNNDMNWGKEVTVPVTIRPLWWQTGLFKVFVLLLGVMAVYQVVCFYRLKERFSNIVYMGQYVSHEMSNPLMSIRSGCDLLLKFLGRQEGADRELKITRNILYNTLEAAEVLETFHDMKPGYSFLHSMEASDRSEEIVGLTEKMVASLVEKCRPCQVAIDIDSVGPIRVFISALDYNVIMRNLLKNAIHAIIEKEARVDSSRRIVVVFSDNRRKGGVSVEVRDTGLGMDARTIKRCRRPNFSTKSKSRGIGLAIVQNKIDKYQMKLKIRSQKNRGSCFTLFIPKRMLADEIKGQNITG